MPLNATKYLVILAILGFTSCELEPCKNNRCVNGTALENYKECICWCNPGWEGADCTVEDKCVTNKVVCMHGGYCNNSGVCVCNESYEGDSCQLLSRDRFLIAGGSSMWTATDTCDATIYQYDIEMLPNSADTRVETYNVRETGTSLFITANVVKFNCDQRLTSQLGDVEIRDLFGTISADSTRVLVTYITEEGVITSSCSGTWLRK